MKVVLDFNLDDDLNEFIIKNKVYIDRHIKYFILSNYLECFKNLCDEKCIL